MKLCSITPVAGDLELRLYETDHSAAALNPKIAGLADNLLSSRAFEIVRKFSEGIDPRNFQLLTADSRTPTSAATAVVPPRAVTMSSTELSIPDDSSRSVNLSSLHARTIDSGGSLSFNKGMDTKENIGERLAFFLKAINETAAKVCKLLEIDDNVWSQYKNGVNLIPLEQADRLCHFFSLTLDFIYRNEPRGIDRDVLIRMLEIQKNEEAGIGVDRGSPMRLRNLEKASRPNRKRSKT